MPRCSPPVGGSEGVRSAPLAGGGKSLGGMRRIVRARCAPRNTPVPFDKSPLHGSNPGRGAVRIVRPLENVRVVEYGPWLNAAYGGRLLADMGAEVIKIEAPDGGEPARLHGPFPGDAPGAEASAQHLFNNANKLGVTLDPSSATGRRLFRRLAATADVLIDGTQPGELDALGLGHEALAGDNPRLIMVAVSSLGRSGPYAGYRGYDLTSWHGERGRPTCTWARPIASRCGAPTTTPTTGGRCRSPRRR